MIISAYKTPAGKARASFTERKSEFIGSIRPASSEQQALDFLEEIRAANRKANHNCYAYILRENNITRFSDDGEPSGTAGAVILDTLKKESLINAVCVVTRYFGGILLGAGGLSRAYSKAAALAVSESGVKTMSPAAKLCITLDYPLYGVFERAERKFLSGGVSVLTRDFGEKIALTLYVRADLSDKFVSELTDACNGKIIVEHLQIEHFFFG